MKKDQKNQSKKIQSKRAVFDLRNPTVVYKKWPKHTKLGYEKKYIYIKAGFFLFVCTYGSRASYKFQIEILKIERSIAEMPFFPLFVESSRLIYGIEFGSIS